VPRRCLQLVSCKQVIVGTHGRLKNWVAKRQLEIDHINILVFDEADEMLKADAFADDSGATAECLGGVECRQPPKLAHAAMPSPPPAQPPQTPACRCPQLPPGRVCLQCA
jgi:hypothetical protein